MLIKKVIESMTLSRIEWQKRIHMADPDQSGEDPQPTPKFLKVRLSCCCCCFTIHEICLERNGAELANSA